MTPPDTLDFILDVVRKMAYIVKYKNGRILVHCHAGNGRTGIVLVCFFMYYFNKTYNQALKELRKLRKKGVEKTPQEIYCQKFEEYLKEIKNIFPSKRQKIHVFIKNQKILDYNFDKDKCYIPSIVICYYFKDNNLNNIKDIFKKIIDIDYIPRLIFECIEKIIEIKIFKKMPLKELYLILNGMNELKDISLNEIKKIKMQLKVNNWDLFKKQDDLSIISELLFIWLNEYVYYCIDPQKVELIIDKLISKFLPKQRNQTTLPESKIVTESNDIDNNYLNDVQNLFSIFDNNENKNIEVFNQMINIIRSELSKLEYETIKYMSLFLQIIYPTNKLNSDYVEVNLVNNINANNHNQIYEYKRLIYKFCLFLLGYNLDKVNTTPNKFSKSKELLDAKMLIFIFELFIFYNNKITNETPLIEENEDLLFKYKKNVDLISIKDFL